MANNQGKVKSILSNMVSTMIEGDTREWPPECPLFLYQPVRPCVREKKEEVEQINCCKE